MKKKKKHRPQIPFLVKLQGDYYYFILLSKILPNFCIQVQTYHCCHAFQILQIYLDEPSCVSPDQDYGKGGAKIFYPYCLYLFIFLSISFLLHGTFISYHKDFCAISSFLLYIEFYNGQSLPQNIPIKFRFLSTAFNNVCLKGYSKQVLNLHLFSSFV